MDLRIFTEPQQGADYDDLLRVAQAAEAAGYDAFFRSDHYLAMGDASGEPGPTDAWLTLAGLARETSRIRLAVVDSPALPKPVQQPAPPIVIGGRGKRRTPELAARYASEFNVPFSDIDAAAAQFERVDAACTAIGRDPSELVRSVAQIVCVGRDDAEIAARARTLGREVDELRANGLTGTPAEVVDRIGACREKAGVTRLYLQLMDLADLDQIDLIAAQVAPHL